MPGRDVEAGDVVVADAVEVLDQGAQELPWAVTRTVLPEARSG
jgi:hypothetical protein